MSYLPYVHTTAAINRTLLYIIYTIVRNGNFYINFIVFPALLIIKILEAICAKTVTPKLMHAKGGQKRPVFLLKVYAALYLT